MSSHLFFCFKLKNCLTNLLHLLNNILGHRVKLENIGIDETLKEPSAKHEFCHHHL